MSITCAIFIVLCGIAFVISAAHLFFTGGANPYSRERVGEYLSYLAIPSVLTIILVIARLIYDLVTKEKTGDGFKRSESEMLEGYAKRFDFDSLNDKTKNVLTHERAVRKKCTIISRSFSAAFFAMAIIYLSFIANYTVENLNKDVIFALAIALPLIAAAISAEVIRTFLCERSSRREREALLEAVKMGYKPCPPKGEKISDTDTKKETVLKYAILIIGVVLIVIGVFNGGMTDVLDKAVKICTECIGLG